MSSQKEALEGFEQIGDYELLEMIGQGAMGRVFMARQVSLGRIVALKILPPALARSQTFTERFLHEARASGKLVHPNVVQGIDCGRDENSGLWYFAMEYIDGYALSEELERCHALTEKRTIEVGIAVAGALEVAARQGIVHRDIKPANILISQAGEIKLADLGLAKISAQSDPSLTRADTTVGTPYYLAPEQARGLRDQIDTRTDIYSLGATLFHLVTGRPPYEGETHREIMVKHINEEVPLAHQVDPNVGEPLSLIIAKMMQKQPEQRFQTPTQLREALERAKLGNLTSRGGTTRFAAVPKLGPRSRAPVARRPVGALARRKVRSGSNQSFLICGVVAILLALIALVFFLVNG